MAVGSGHAVGETVTADGVTGRPINRDSSLVCRDSIGVGKAKEAVQVLITIEGMISQGDISRDRGAAAGVQAFSYKAITQDTGF